MDDVLRLQEHAACAGADPNLFDWTTYEEALPALRMCRDCPVVDLCGDVIRPHRSYFDGVAAGAVWRNGMKVLADGRTIGPRARDFDTGQQMTLGEAL